MIAKIKVNNGEFNGATYLPNVDAEGNISWTNNKGLENPSSQNIRGPQRNTRSSRRTIQNKENIFINRRNAS